MKPLLLFIGSLIVLYSCKENRKFVFSQISIRQQLEIIDLCITNTLSVDSALNKGDYYIDFSDAPYLTDSAILIYLQTHGNLQKVNPDSLFKNNKQWAEKGFLDKALIDFTSIEIHDDSVKVKTSKTLSTLAAEGVETLLIKKGEELKVLDFHITWIS